MLPVDADVRAVFADAVAVFADLGCTLVEAAPVAPEPVRLWNTIALAEGYASEGPFLTTSRDRLAPGTAEIIEAGRDITAARYIDALHDRARYTRIWAEFFERFDLLLTPTMQLTAFGVDLQTPPYIEGRPVDPFFDDWCTTCLPANLTGMPATSVPAGFGASGMPVGLQVMGPRWADGLTLRAAAAFERVVGWQRFVPPLSRTPG
jgi:Asp-tRNA(Asn)/Glu-tRNA(Gln) amidotransferase A subunit family amidase